MYMYQDIDEQTKQNTVEPVLKDNPIEHTNVVSQDSWPIILKCRTFCEEQVVFQDRWSLMAVFSQDRFHCIRVPGLANCLILQ